MINHNTAERKLKTDIHYKNSIRRDLVDSIRQLHEWQSKLSVIRNKRKERKLGLTVRRYQGFIEEMRSFLSPLLDELEESIKVEMNFSKDEISQFKQDIKEEIKLASDARAAFQKVSEMPDDTEKLKPEDLALLQDAYSKAWRAFRLEKHKLEKAEKELESEMVDRKIFERELKRIHVEQHFIKD